MLENFSFNKLHNALAVSVFLPQQKLKNVEYSLMELKLLAKTLGINVKQTFIQKRDKYQPNYLIGRGKLDEIKGYINDHDIDVILFDNDLSGVQERNLEKYLDKTIFGRTEIILNIFHKRAKTNEAMLQVKLASLEYMMPRLRNRWDHFSRVEGGIGLRGGEGEKQIELDRRMIQDQIMKIKKKLKKVDTQMSNRRKRRLDSNVVSLVGYTNAGKSSLFNILAKTNVFTGNMLFATLDSTIKKVYINDDLNILLNDTVGFINKLPHSLVASFKSTLDEIINSKLILHIIDVSSPYIDVHISSVVKTLTEIKADHIPCIRIFNKIDLLENGSIDHISIPENDDIYISVHDNKNIDKIKNKILECF